MKRVVQVVCDEHGLDQEGICHGDDMQMERLNVYFNEANGGLWPFCRPHCTYFIIFWRTYTNMALHASDHVPTSPRQSMHVAGTKLHLQTNLTPLRAQGQDQSLECQYVD